MILCVGVTGSGKTMLLRQMQEHGLNLLKEAKMDTMTSEVTKPSTTPKISTALTSVPTIGTDLITLSRSLNFCPNSETDFYFYLTSCPLVVTAVFRLLRSCCGLLQVWNNFKVLHSKRKLETWRGELLLND